MTRDHKLALVRAAVLSADPEAMEAAAHMLAALASDEQSRSEVVLHAYTPAQRIAVFAVWAFAGHRKSRSRRARMRDVERWASEIAETGALSYGTRWRKEGGG